MKYCFSCGTEWTGLAHPGFRETCVSCGKDLHVCLNCAFYDTAAPRQCRVEGVELVTEKDRCNLCDEFQFSDLSPETFQKKSGSGTASSSGIKSQWENLFRK
jgi:hypothetical protein